MIGRGFKYLTHLTPLFLLPCLFAARPAIGQQASVEEVTFFTQEWEGERSADGRPRVSDDLLERMKYVMLEDAWWTLRTEGYHNKFEGNWEILHPGQIMVGRALTATFIPSSPELRTRMTEVGRAEGRTGGMNSWPINMLQQGDVYVADGFGKIKEGTLIGNNLGQGIYANSGNGPVFFGAARDQAGLRQIDGFNAWVKGWHPSAINEMMLSAINTPTRIGEAVVMPGDVVLAEETGVLFIPPHLAESIVVRSEITRLEDRFRQQRIVEGVYNIGQTYGVQWTDAIEEDFFGWLKTNRVQMYEQHGVGYDTIDSIIEARSRNRRDW